MNRSNKKESRDKETVASTGQTIKKKYYSRIGKEATDLFLFLEITTLLRCYAMTTI